MVAQADLRLNFILFKLYSFLCFHPSKVEIKSCTITFLSTGFKAMIHRGIWAFVVTYYAFSGLQLFRSAINKQTFVPAHFPIHLLCIEYSYFVLYQAYTLAISNPERTTTLLREIFKFSPTPANHTESLLKRLKERLRTWNIQDLVMVSFPSTLLGVAMGMIAIFLMDPNRAQLIYSLLEPHQKNPWTLAACIGIEIYCQIFGHAFAGLVIVSQLSFFKTAAGKLNGRWDPTRISTDKLIKKFRKLQVLVTLFNDSFCVIVFGMKQFCIYVCILQASFGLVYMQKDVMIGAFCLGIAMEAAISYVVLYDHAFAIPLTVERIKQNIIVGRLKMARGNLRGCDAQGTAILKKALKSVPRLAVKVGTFGRMEQSSTPQFLNFVTTQTVGLLITLRS